MVHAITRRRFIGISAAATGLALLPLGSALAAADAVIWEGQALGAPAQLVIHHQDRQHAERLTVAVAAEVRRLERIFSLYRDDSELQVLNRRGLHPSPSPELLEVLSTCRAVWQATEGAFDPTVQSLWMLLARHFSQAGADPAGPDDGAIAAALAQTGFDGVRFNQARVEFAKPGMALTLNGIAQGYITDRIVDLLRAGGIGSCLVDMGENHALGRRADGTPWRVGIADPLQPGSVLDVLQVVDRAVATSSPYGFHFDAGARFSHLIDPRRGRAARRYDSVTVLADRAMLADALSTAFSLMDPEAIGRVVRSRPDVEAYLLPADGAPVWLRGSVRGQAA